MENISYLEKQDINDNGDLKPYVGKGKPVIIMAQGNFCHYCTDAKPAFQELNNKTNIIVVATILVDGETPEKEAAKFLTKWDPNHRGVPAYFGFDKTGKFKSLHTGKRDLKSLEAFAKTL